jgi:hypothetical protein
MSRRWALLIFSGLTVLQWLFVIVAVQRPAYGYVDPGSGMLVVQFIGSILGGGIFFLRKRLKQLFSTGKSTPVSSGAGETKP